MAVFGFKSIKRRKIGSKFSLISWLTTDSSELSDIVRRAQFTVYKLMDKQVLPFSLFDLKLRAKVDAGEDLSTEYLRLALKTFECIEVVEDEQYQWKIECLSSLADKAYRIMSEQTQKQAMPVRDIHKEINHRLTLANSTKKCKLRSLITQMVEDTRFKAVGRGGSWVLSDWEGVSIDLITEYHERIFLCYQR